MQTYINSARNLKRIILTEKKNQLAIKAGDKNSNQIKTTAKDENSDHGWEWLVVRFLIAQGSKEGHTVPGNDLKSKHLSIFLQ